MLGNKIIIIDEEAERRESYKILINNSSEFTVIGAFNSWEESFPELTKLYPSIIIMDIECSENSGIEGIRKIKKQFPQIAILINTHSEDLNDIQEAFKAGVSGYLSKKCPVTDLLKALNDLENNGCPISPKIAKIFTSNLQLNGNGPLSKREREILQLYAQGYGYSIIAERLFVTKSTIKTHLRNIYNKLDASGKEEAIEFAREKRYIS